MKEEIWMYHNKECQNKRIVKNLIKIKSFIPILLIISFLLFIPVSVFAYNIPPVPITNELLYKIWQTRPDIHSAYPEVANGSYTNIYNWAVTEPNNQSDRSTSEGLAYMQLQSKHLRSPNYLETTSSTVLASGPIGSQFTWNQTAGAGNNPSPFQCTSYSFTNNTVISSIGGSISYAMSEPVDHPYDETQSLVHFFLSPVPMQSFAHMNNGQCTDMNDVIVNSNNFDNYNFTSITGAVNVKVTGNGYGILYFNTPTINLPMYLLHKNYTNIVIISDYLTDTKHGFWDVEPQMIIYGYQK